jgi:hypothetical protein
VRRLEKLEANRKWNVGILEEWNNGFLEVRVGRGNGSVRSDWGLEKDIILSYTQHSTIPSFLYSNSQG